MAQAVTAYRFLVGMAERLWLGLPSPRVLAGVAIGIALVLILVLAVTWPGPNQILETRTCIPPNCPGMNGNP